MKPNILSLGCVLLAATAIVRAQEDAGAAAIKQILGERIEKEKRSTGMVVRSV